MALASIAARATPDLSFAVGGVDVVRHAVVPTIRFRLRIERPGGGVIDSIALQTQLRLAAERRRYEPEERERLAGLFGRPEQWSRSLKSLHWANAATVVPGFEGSTEVDLPVTLTYDFEVAAAQYLNALEGGEVPVDLLFSGTVFYRDPDDRLQAAMISWDKEVRARLPVAVWRRAMDEHFPDSGWLRLRCRELDRLQAYRARHALPTWEHVIASLLERAEP